MTDGCAVCAFAIYLDGKEKRKMQNNVDVLEIGKKYIPEKCFGCCILDLLGTFRTDRGKHCASFESVGSLLWPGPHVRYSPALSISQILFYLCVTISSYFIFSF